MHARWAPPVVRAHPGRVRGDAARARPATTSRGPARCSPTRSCRRRARDGRPRRAGARARVGWSRRSARRGAVGAVGAPARRRRRRGIEGAGSCRRVVAVGFRQREFDATRTYTVLMLRGPLVDHEAASRAPAHAQFEPATRRLRPRRRAAGANRPPRRLASSTHGPPHHRLRLLRLRPRGAEVARPVPRLRGVEHARRGAPRGRAAPARRRRRRAARAASPCGWPRSRPRRTRG